MSAFRRIAILGFGEAGGILGADLARTGRAVATYDLLLDEPATRGALRAKAEAAGVRPCDSAREAVSGAELVLCAVTAEQAVHAATSAAAALGAGQLFLDINSVSPAAKQGNARAIERSGADYLDAAVMASVPHDRLAVPMLIAGRRAAEVTPALRALGLNASIISDRVGVASAVKMCRSIVIKGLEALAVESLFAARRFGAEGEVLASLERTFPGMGWQDSLPDYLVSRVAEHGRRRAAEMREVARTLEDAGLEPLMALAAARRQEQLVEAMRAQRIEYARERAFSWRRLADALAGQEDAAGAAGGRA
jgi:3-hydroxyisobutyrate dehydrogenase-like beta-hydroxyacid dehydrogenase